MIWGLHLHNAPRSLSCRPQKMELLWFWYLFASISSTVYLRAYCSYASLMPLTWMAATHSALYIKGQKELSTGSKVEFFDARSTRGETWEVTGEMRWREQHSYSATSSAWPSQITTLSTPGCLTELFPRKMPVQLKKKIVFPVQLARRTRACPENTSVAATPIAQGLYTCE